VDAIGLILLIWFAGSILFLAIVEGYTAVKGLPVISERVARLGKNAQIVVIWTTFVIGYLLAHFFDQWRNCG
jgi:hypothetical protein